MSVLQEYNIFKNILSFFPLSKYDLCPSTHAISLVKSFLSLEKSQLIIYFNNIKNIIDFSKDKYVFTIEIIWVDGHNPYLFKGKNDNIFLNILYSCNTDIKICIIYFNFYIYKRRG